MNLTITGRHVQVSDRLKDHADKKVSRLEKYFNQIIDIQMILVEEKNNKKVELVIHADGAKFYASDMGSDYYSCIDTLLDKLDQQVKKYKDKSQDHKSKEKMLMPIIDLDTEEQEDVTFVEGTNKPLDIKEAYLEMKMDKMDYLLFKNDTEGKVGGIGYSLLYNDSGAYRFICADEKNVDKSDVVSSFQFYDLNIVADSETDPDLSLEKSQGSLKRENISQALQSFENQNGEVYVFYNTEINSLGLIKKKGARLELALPAR